MNANATPPAKDAADRIAEAIHAARVAHPPTAPKPFSLRDAADVIRRVLAVEFPAGKPRPKKPADPSKPPLTGPVDEAFLDWCQSQEACRYIDVRRENQKAQLWASTNKVPVSRRRLVNWLNKAEPTTGFDWQARQAGKPAAQGAEPEGWREWVRANATDPSHADREWASLDAAARKYITEQMKKGTP